MQKKRSVAELQTGEASSNQCDFVLEPENYDALLELLKVPAKLDAGLIELMNCKAPWDSESSNASAMPEQ